MLQQLRESLLPNQLVRIAITSSNKAPIHSKSKSTDHVTLDGFDGSETSSHRSQSRRKSRSRALIKDHRVGAGIVNVMIYADECVYQLQQVASRLAIIASRNEQLAKGILNRSCFHTHFGRLLHFCLYLNSINIFRLFK